MLDLGHHLICIEIISAFAILIHNVLAKAVIPSLQLVIYNFIVDERALYMAITVEAGSFIIHYHVVRCVNIAIAKVDSVILAVSNDIVLELAS